MNQISVDRKAKRDRIDRRAWMRALWLAAIAFGVGVGLFLFLDVRLSESARMQILITLVLAPCTLSGMTLATMGILASKSGGASSLLTRRLREGGYMNVFSLRRD